MVSSKGMRGVTVAYASFPLSSIAVSAFLQSVRLSSAGVSTVPADYHGEPDPVSSSPSAQTPLPESSPARSAVDVFRRWGCSDADTSAILRRYPPAIRKDLAALDAKLRVLHDLGFLGRDLTRLITLRPAFLSYSKEKLFGDLVPRLGFLLTIFSSDDGVRAAITRNPALLTCELGRMRRCVELYESVGVTRVQLGVILRGRPTTMCRSKLDAQKLDIIERTGLTRDSNLYKYVVSIVAVSRLDTLQEKIANFEKFGFSPDEVLKLFGRSPYLMTLSVEKVQRNMTYIVGTLKLPAQNILNCPQFLYCTIVRMQEGTFLRTFVTCYEEQDVVTLMDFYNEVRGVRRLAEKSRKICCRGFLY